MTVSAFDVALFQAIHIDAAASPAWEGFAETVAVWGIAVVPLVLARLWLSRSRASRSTGVVAGLAATLAVTVAGLFSWTVYVPRPFSEGLAPNVLHHVADSSFPSDHLAVLGAVFFSMLLARRAYPAAILGLATLGVGWARIALGVHFPSDVAGALAIGALSALLFRTRPLSRFVHFVRQVGEAIAGPARCASLARRLHILNSEGRPTWPVFKDSRHPH